MRSETKHLRSEESILNKENTVYQSYENICREKYSLFPLSQSFLYYAIRNPSAARFEKLGGFKREKGHSCKQIKIYWLCREAGSWFSWEEKEIKVSSLYAGKNASSFAFVYDVST